jgi:outer membrane lipoprotein-sorting protein
LFYLVTAPTTTATASFAEAAQKLHDAHTLSYRMTTETPDLKQPMTMRAFFKEPNRMRVESDAGVVSVADASQGKLLVLDPATKTALLTEGAAAKTAQAAGGGFAERMRQLVNQEARPVGEKNIGDTAARGYLVKVSGEEMTIWIDPKTNLPLRMEASIRFQGKEIRTTLTDFQIDPVLDDALFRMEPPPGYAINRGQSDLLGMDEKTFTDPEKATVALLRIFAAKSGGSFPKRLDDFSEFDAIFPKPKRPAKLPDAETMGAVQALTRFLMATRPLKEGFGYKPDGVKLGDAGKILFWYRPEGSVNYRAIYGDLHAADVTPDKLPEKPKS